MAVVNLHDISFRKLLDDLYENQFPSYLIRQYDIQLLESLDAQGIKIKWMYPLVCMLFEAIKSNEKADICRSIYIGERINRPFLDKVSNAEKAEYFSLIIANDIAILKSYFGDLGLIDSFHDFATCLKSENTITLLTIGDCLLSHNNSLLSHRMSEYDLSVSSIEQYLGGLHQQNWDLDVVGVAGFSSADIVAISPFTYWGVPQFRVLMIEIWNGCNDHKLLNRLFNYLMDFIRSIISFVRNYFQGTVLLHNASGIPWLVEGIRLNHFPWELHGYNKNPILAECFIGKINNALDELVAVENRVILVDERRIVSHHGRDDCAHYILALDLMKLSLFHYDSFSFYLSDEYIFILNTLNSLSRKKVIFIDFDNTLWDGVMAESAVAHWYDRQRTLQALSELGVLLVAMSRNNPENIRWSELRISYDAFCILKINMNSKVSNIIRAAKELNISQDQTIFIDDSPEELEMVRIYLPDVHVMDSRQENTWKALDIFLSSVDKKSAINLSRSGLYFEKFQRDKFLKGESSQVESADSINANEVFFMLNLRVKVTVNQSVDLPRIYELLLRTNQFSSVKRVTLEALNKILEYDSKFIFAFHAQDKFGDMGLVGAALVKRCEGFYLIEEFALSCRAMGLGIEDFMLAHIRASCQAPEYKFLYIKTSKNLPVRKFLQRAGFGEDPSMDFCFRCDDKNLKLNLPDWIALDQVL